MASLGKLTAGIAHEIKNPLNFVNNFALLSVDLADELDAALDAAGDTPAETLRQELAELVAELKANAAKIVDHGRRADGIVKSMLAHSRGGKGTRRPVDVNALVAEYADLAYHGMRAKHPGIQIHLKQELAPEAGSVSLVPEEIGRVLINLISNAFDAVRERNARNAADDPPTVTVRTRPIPGAVEIEIADNGDGIPADVRERIFEPFFTTKPTGEGTGLGLSIAYDIVTAGHGGALTVESHEGEGTRFTLCLPADPAEEAEAMPEETDLDEPAASEANPEAAASSLAPGNGRPAPAATSPLPRRSG
jgi:signal transduction histidine kinase